MEQISKTENQPYLTSGTLWLMAIGAGLVVANLYYNQPLLSMIAKELGESEAATSKVAMITQLGYATGLLLIVPMGDMFRRKRIILVDFICMLASLLAFAVSQSLTMMVVSSFFIGLTSVIPQIFIPIAAQLSPPGRTAKNVSMIVSGILIGILASRVFSGVLAEYLGWRMVFFIAIGILFVLALFIAVFLPAMEATFEGTYKQLMRSILYYIRLLPDLRMASVRGALVFASFSMFWTTLVFRLEQPPFYAGSDVAGLLGLVGITGAVAATITGSLTNKVGQHIIITAGACIMLLAWLAFGIGGASYIGLIAGIVLLDMGIQAINISNQSLIFASHKEATNRINTAYMVAYFVGGALGTWIGGLVWGWFGWPGVVSAGGGVVVLCLLVHLLFNRKV